MREVKTVYEEFLHLVRTGEARMAPPTTPVEPESQQDVPIEADVESQSPSQPMSRTETLRNPRQNTTAVEDEDTVVRGEAPNATATNGVGVRQPLPRARDNRPLPQTQHQRPELQNNRIARPDAKEDGLVLLVASALVMRLYPG